MKDLSSEVLKPRVAGLLLSLLLCLFGAVFADIGAARTLLGVGTVILLLTAYLFDMVGLAVIAVGFLFSCMGEFVIWAHYDQSVRAGYSFMIAGIWLAFICLCPDDLIGQLKHWGGLYRILCAVALFFDLLGTFLLWGSVPKGGPAALSNGVTACLSGILFFFASTYQAEVWVWVSLFWSSYFQYTLLVLSVGSCNTVQVCSAGGVIAWLGHLGFIGLLAVSFEAQEKERSKILLGLVALCGVLTVVATVVAGGLHADIDLANSYAVFSIAFLLWSQYSTEGLGTSLVTISAGYMLSISGILVWGAHVAHLAHESHVLTGCALSVAMVWLANAIFHANPREWSESLLSLKGQPAKIGALLAFALNFLGLTLWWVRLDTAASPALMWSVEALLCSLFVLDTIVLRQEPVLKHVWLSLFYAARIVTIVMPLVSVGGGEGIGEKGLGQVGSAFVWVSHMIFMVVLCSASAKKYDTERIVEQKPMYPEISSPQPPISYQPMVYHSSPKRDSIGGRSSSPARETSFQLPPSSLGFQAQSARDSPRAQALSRDSLNYHTPPRDSLSYQSPARESPVVTYHSTPQ